MRRMREWWKWKISGFLNGVHMGELFAMQQQQQIRALQKGIKRKNRLIKRLRAELELWEQTNNKPLNSDLYNRGDLRE